MKRLVSLCLILFFLQFGLATEGMWLPLLLNQLNEAEMQEMGMKMTAEDIYSVNKGSLKDAIVHFGGFCTGELISAEGLVLTNFHCGKGQIQSHSSLESNYLEQGFWAQSKEEEIPNPGLFARFIVRIEDVTEQALAGVGEDLPENERQSMVDQNLEKIQSAANIEDYQEVFIRPFFNGNQYFLFVTETYRDVRLVGTPPASIGEFGKDTDNWVWPRHTGDFSLFRIYAGPDNQPAAYSPDNQPYVPRHYLPISLDGISEGDFTMGLGFPGRTNEYLPAVAVEMQVDVLSPIQIAVGDRSLAILDEAMRADEEVRIQYASKQAGIANFWKKSIGERFGVHRTNALAEKKAYEEQFMNRVNKDPKLREKYGRLLAEFETLYERQRPYAVTRRYISEINFSVELFRISSYLNRLQSFYRDNGEAVYRQRVGSLQRYLEGFYPDYRPSIDQKVFASLMEVYFTQVAPEYRSPYAVEQLAALDGSYTQLADRIYRGSVLTKAESMLALLNGEPAKVVETLDQDPAMQFIQSILQTNDELVMPVFNEIQEQLVPLQRRYMKAQMEVFPEKTFYPDANSTLRVSYGKVAGYSSRDAVRYEEKTYLSGVMEKYEPGDYEFDVPEKLRMLYEQKDYGPYAENGQLPVCYISTLHITGGNSGSPAIDAHGNLVGLLFDSNWEGTMSDLYYDSSICRTIAVDIRYVLFLIDKFAGAGHIIQELKMVKPKS